MNRRNLITIVILQLLLLSCNNKSSKVETKQIDSLFVEAIPSNQHTDSISVIDGISHAEEFQYWDDLEENSKSEIIKSIDVEKNIMKLYLHEIKLSDDDMSATILDKLCSSTDGYKRMLHFYVLNEIVNTADGALAEMVGRYCVKYVNENTDYALEYFSKHQDVANNYADLIASELYLSDTGFTQYKQILFNSAKSKCSKDYLPIFLKEIERTLAKID